MELIHPKVRKSVYLEGIEGLSGELKNRQEGDFLIE